MISSVNNKKIKNLIKLKDKKYRDKEGLYLVETFHLVEEAYNAGVLVEVLVLSSDKFYDVETTQVSCEVMNKLSSLDSICNIIGVVKKEKKDNIVGNRILLLDRIQDPGNLGTIIRSAVAFNISDIILSCDCVDVFSSKVIRSSEGMLFHINIVRKDLEKAINIIKNKNIKIYSTDVNFGVNPRKLSYEDKLNFALVVGNEGSGVSEKIDSLCDIKLHIPMSDKLDSLNVGVCTSILLYELSDIDE